jgi:phosphoribosyl-ATP pyrophosphohydrolase/phosphoribosyl-AMP cyclohydrolase
MQNDECRMMNDERWTMEEPENWATEQPSNLKFDANGLIPTVVQDANTKDVLTLAYMNAESLAKTLESGETWFYSRSRQELWHKGGTSGNTQKVIEIRYDCDADALLVLVQPNGPACHTGAASCFYRVLDGGTGKQGDRETRKTYNRKTG